MKSIFILLFMLSALNISAQGMCNGHYPGDGHPSWHPCHGNDPEPEPETPTVPIPTGYLFLGIGVGILLGYKKLKN